jgi:hypothetical protein
MASRPIRDPEWKPYAVEGTVAEDAANIAFGVMAMGPVTADFDAVELSVRGATGEWEAVPIPDAGFEVRGCGRASLSSSPTPRPSRAQWREVKAMWGLTSGPKGASSGSASRPAPDRGKPRCASATRPRPR